jgi:Orange carotenoid protein, N-terminal
MVEKTTEDKIVTTVISNVHPEMTDAFAELETDQKLALLWFIYTEVGKSITPAAPGASTASPTIAEGLFGQVAQMSHDEQLQIQRDLVERNNTLIGREYGALSDTTKLLFWYLLAQGMDETKIIPMPADYQLSEAATQCMTKLQALEHSEQISVLRNLVADMGADPETNPHDEETGL